MKLTAVIYSCYELTYKKVFGDIVSRLYPGKSESDIDLKIDYRPDDGKRTIQGQRSLTEYVTRTIRFFEDDKLVHIVAMSNTNFDYDKQHEKDLDPTKKYVFGRKDYHANTYLKQGIANIFNSYYEEKRNYPNVDLYFYLLDLTESYPHNLFNVLSYRELRTIGFKILNIDKIDFSEYEQKTHSNLGSITSDSDISFPSFFKYFNDIKIISAQNGGNKSSMLTTEEKKNEDPNGNIYTVEKYTYYFKSLSAQGYDSLIRLWCMKTLADRENTDIEFILGRQYFHYEGDERSIADKLTGPINEALENANVNIVYLTNNQFLIDKEIGNNAYLSAKNKNNPRNQSLFRNNLYNSGQPMRCLICGDENPNHLKAAHIWPVSSITRSKRERIEFALAHEKLSSLLDETNQYANEFFYKRYTLTNSGYNGFWLCAEHHEEFDRNEFHFYVDESDTLCVCYDTGETRKVEYFLGKIPVETRAFLNERNRDFNNYQHS